MQEAVRGHVGPFGMYKKYAKAEKRKLFDSWYSENMSPIIHYVCSECGYIESYVEEIEKFK